MKVIHSRRGTDASGEQATGWLTSVKMAPRVLQDPKEFPVQEPSMARFRHVSPSTAVSFESSQGLRTLHDSSYSEKYLPAESSQIVRLSGITGNCRGEKSKLSQKGQSVRRDTIIAALFVEKVKKTINRVDTSHVDAQRTKCYDQRRVIYSAKCQYTFQAETRILQIVLSSALRPANLYMQIDRSVAYLA